MKSSDRTHPGTTHGKQKALEPRAVWTRRLPSARCAQVEPPCAEYLTGQKELPEMLPLSFAAGSIEEPVLCAHDLVNPWLPTSGAVEWLRAETPRAR